jgi:pimeloyl-ACP methyl ester carboxylesterase
LKDVPVLLLRGERSDLLSAATARQMAARLNRAELVTVPGVGHAPVLDEPVAVEAMDRLLQRTFQDA